MANYISNVPISRPINLRVDRHVDLNGFMWNSDIGLFIATEDETLESLDLPMDSGDF